MDAYRQFNNEKAANKFEDRVRGIDPEAFGALDPESGMYTIYANVSPRQMKKLGMTPEGH